MRRTEEEILQDLDRQIDQPLDLDSIKANLADIKVAVEQIETILAGGIEI